MSVPSCLRRYGIHLGDSSRLAQTLIVCEEEGVVLHDRPADGATKLIAMERQLRRVEEVSSIKRAIADELKGIPVKVLST